MKYTFGTENAELPALDDIFSIAEINAYEPNDSETFKEGGDNDGTNYLSNAVPDPSAPNAFTFDIDSGCPSNHSAEFTLTMTDAFGIIRTAGYSVTVE